MTAKRNRGIPGPPPLLLSATRRKCPSRSTLRYPFPPHALKKRASAAADSGWRAYSIYTVVVKSSAPVSSAETRRNPSLQRFAFVRRSRSWVPSPLAGEGQGEGKSSGNESAHPNEKCCKLPSAVADRRNREGMGMRDREVRQRRETEPTPPLSFSLWGQTRRQNRLQHGYGSSFSTSRFRVESCPSSISLVTGSPCCPWNSCKAERVNRPITPSIGPGWYPRYTR